MATIVATFIYLTTLNFTPNTDSSNVSESDTTTTECSIIGVDMGGI